MATDTTHRYLCRLRRVVDGDTFEVDVDLGFEVYVVQMVRLNAVDTPEMNTKAGRQAKQAVIDWFGEHDQVHTLVSYRQKDKYGRRVCDVEHADTGEVLSEWLLLNGLAVPWPRRRAIHIPHPWEH